MTTLCKKSGSLAYYEDGYINSLLLKVFENVEQQGRDLPHYSGDHSRFVPHIPITYGTPKKV
jgi:hypothetical protein